MRLNRYTSWLLPFGIALLASCGGGSSSSGNSSTSSSVMQVSIDAMTAVPVINGSSTRGILYIHNYGTQTATGLNFGLNNATTNSKIKSALSNLGLHLNGALLNQNGFALLNPERCTAIPVGGSCAINFSTPELAVGDRGNSLVTLSYKINGHNATTNQVVNYQYVSLSALSGVNFTAGSLNVSGAQGNTRHVVGYLYGGGSTGSKYQNVNLVSNSLATNISNGFINGQEVVSGQVIPVEFAVTLQNDKNSGVNVIPQWGGISQANVANKTTLGTPSAGSGGALSLYLIPAQNTVNYIFGDISVLAAPTVTPVVINVTNNGNADGSGNLTATSDNNALTIDDSNCVSTALLANAVNSCTISFSVPGYTSGSATVTFKNSTDQTVGTQIVIWTNNMPVPAVYITPNQSSITFGKGVATPDNSTVFTLNNVGKAPLNTATYTPTNTGPATWMQDGTTCGSTIAPQGTCTISGHFVGTNDGTGTLYYQALGSYNSTNYSFVALPLRYEVTAAPSLTITPIGISLTLLANGVDVKTQTFNVINQGSDPALFSALSLLESNTQVKPTISGGTCSDSTTLAETESCSVIVSYGPAAESNTANESGIAIVNLNYHGGTPDMTYNVQDNFNYNLVGNDTTVVVGGPTATIPGNGEESNPFRGNPSLEPMQITLTYTNPSVNYGLTNFNLNTNNLPYGLVVDPSSTCTTGSAVMNLAKGQSCNLVLKVDRDLLTTSASGGSIVLNYTSPTATWTTPLGFYSQAGSMVYVNYLQPTIAFTLSNNNSYFYSTILTMTAANESTTTTLTVNISSVSNWLESVPINQSSNCSINNSDYSVSCNLKITTMASVTYIMPNYLQAGENASIPLIFGTDTNEYAYLNPEYIFINSPSIRVNLPQTGQVMTVPTGCTSGNCITSPIGSDGYGYLSNSYNIPFGVTWAYNGSRALSPSPRFIVDPVDSDCIIDELTGLEWPKNGTIGFNSGVSSNLLAQPAYANTTLINNRESETNALLAVANMNTAVIKLCGHDDWRLPNINEIASVVNLGESNPAIWLNKSAQGFINMQPDNYWSSTTYAPNISNAYFVSMNNGFMTGYMYPKTMTYHVWPVRSYNSHSIPLAQIPQTGQTTSYAANDDGALQKGTVGTNVSGRFMPAKQANGTACAVGEEVENDMQTGLMWVKSPTLTQYTWTNAIAKQPTSGAAIPQSYCGYTDWRLPNRNELRSLVNYGVVNPGGWLNSQGFIGIVDTNASGKSYWTSTTSASTGSAWIFNMFDGGVSSVGKSSIDLVWPVRGGQ